MTESFYVVPDLTPKEPSQNTFNVIDMTQRILYTFERVCLFNHRGEVVHVNEHVSKMTPLNKSKQFDVISEITALMIIDRRKRDEEMKRAGANKRLRLLSEKEMHCNIVLFVDILLERHVTEANISMLMTEMKKTREQSIESLLKNNGDVELVLQSKIK